MCIAKPEELSYRLAYSAYANSSHYPEKGAEREQKDFANHINGVYSELLSLCTNEAQRTLLETEIQLYKTNYLSKYGAVLQANSRTASSFITGPANFPTRANQKKLDTAHRRLEEFLEWEKKAQASMRKKIADARTEDEKMSSEWEVVKERTLRTLSVILKIDTENYPADRSLFVSSLAGRIKTLAENGEVHLVEKALALITEYNATHAKPAVTKSHSIWKLIEVAQTKQKVEENPRESKCVHEGEGVKVVMNFEEDRLQIFFDGIPSPEMRQKLKAEAWRWSPTQGAWQRQLTNNARYSASRVLGLIK